MAKQMENEKRYVFLNLKVTNGEYEYNFPSVHITKCKDLDFFAQKYAAEFYRDRDVYRINEAWYCHLGCVATSVEVVKEISKEHYDILKEYLA